jgi:hypothetical protein
MHDATHHHPHRPVGMGLDRLKGGPEALAFVREHAIEASPRPSTLRSA